MASAADSRAVHDDLIAPVAEDLSARAVELADTMVAQYVAALPEVFRDAETAEAAHASTVASIRAMARGLTGAVDVSAFELPPETVAFARDCARQAVPMAPLLRTYRLGQSALWRMLVPELAARATDAGQLAVAVDVCSERLFAYIDLAYVLAEDVYAAERERFARTAAAVRTETIAALLDGSLTDAARAGQSLRYELGRVHLAVWSWLDHAPERGDAYELLEAALFAFARAAGCPDPLVQPLGTYAVAGWIPATPSLDVAALAATRVDVAQHPGVRFALGEPAEGVAGFRSSHVQATRARRVATLAGRAVGSVTRYEAVALQALATEDVEHAREFALRVLGPLTSGDDTTLRLAATLRAYLEENGSRGRTARRLGIHENTVSYRVKQVEEVLGRGVDEDALNLRVALSLLPVVRRR